MGQTKVTGSDLVRSATEQIETYGHNSLRSDLYHGRNENRYTDGETTAILERGKQLIEVGALRDADLPALMAYESELNLFGSDNPGVYQGHSAREYKHLLSEVRRAISSIKLDKAADACKKNNPKWHPPML